MRDDVRTTPPRITAMLVDGSASLAALWIADVTRAALPTIAPAWLTLTAGAIAGLVVSQAALMSLATFRAGSLLPMARLAVGCLGGAVLVWLVAPDAWPRTLLAAQIWLTVVLALAWRSLWWLAAAQRPGDNTVEAGLESPGRSPGPLQLLRRHRTLLRLLVRRDLKLKYRGSVVGFFWSLANPLVMTATYTAAFTYLFPMRGEGFIFLLLLGVLTWTFFATSAGMATGAIVDSGSLVRSIYFPRTILPTATVGFNLVQYVLALTVLLPCMFLLYQRWPSAALLALPAQIVLVSLVTLGLALLLAAATATYRDVRHLLDITLQVLFWATPILYAPAQLPAAAGQVVAFSPLAPFIALARASAYEGVWPTGAHWLLSGAYAGSALAIGLAVFLRHEDRFAE